jgi:hypothetical protein
VIDGLGEAEVRLSTTTFPPSVDPVTCQGDDEVGRWLREACVAAS